MICYLFAYPQHRYHHPKTCLLYTSCVGGLVGCGDEVSQQYIISSVSLEEKIRGTQFAGTVIGKSYAMITIKNVFTYSKLYDELNRTYLTDKQEMCIRDRCVYVDGCFRIDVR